MTKVLPLWLLLAACAGNPTGGENRTAGGDGGGSGFFARMRPGPKPLENCADLAKWLAKHGDGFTSRVEGRGFVLEANYRPAACAACMEARGAAFADSSFRQRVAQLNRGELYVLKLTPVKGRQDSAAVELTEDWAQNLMEVVGRDTFPCSFIHVEALPSLLPYRTALVGFDRPQDGQDRRLVLHDPAGRFGGDLTLAFPQGSLKAYLTMAPDTLTSPRS